MIKPQKNPNPYNDFHGLVVKAENMAIDWHEDLTREDRASLRMLYLKLYDILHEIGAAPYADISMFVQHRDVHFDELEGTRTAPGFAVDFHIVFFDPSKPRTPENAVKALYYSENAVTAAKAADELRNTLVQGTYDKDALKRSFDKFNQTKLEAYA
jgi:hypothetical protein